LRFKAYNSRMFRILLCTYSPFSFYNDVFVIKQLQLAVLH